MDAWIHGYMDTWIHGVRLCARCCNIPFRIIDCELPQSRILVALLDKHRINRRTLVGAVLGTRDEHRNSLGQLRHGRAKHPDDKPLGPLTPRKPKPHKQALVTQDLPHTSTKWPTHDGGQQILKDAGHGGVRGGVLGIHSGSLGGRGGIHDRSAVVWRWLAVAVGSWRWRWRWLAVVATALQPEIGFFVEPSTGDNT